MKICSEFGMFPFVCLKVMALNVDRHLQNATSLRSFCHWLASQLFCKTTTETTMIFGVQREMNKASGKEKTKGHGPFVLKAVKFLIQ